jgi:Family of unknown function (DUF5677)
MTSTNSEATVQDYAASLKKHAEIMLAASVMDATEPEDSRDKGIRQTLIRASELVRASSTLSLENNHISTSILARALLENLILILWLMLKDSNPKELEDAGINELARATRINLENGKAHIQNKLTGEDETKVFLNSERFKNIPKRKSIANYAQEADVMDLYNIFYRFLSLETHGHEVEKNNDNNIQSIEDMQCIGALAMAIGHAGTKWLLHRQQTDNEILRKLLGFDSD